MPSEPSTRHCSSVWRIFVAGALRSVGKRDFLCPVCGIMAGSHFHGRFLLPVSGSILRAGPATKPSIFRRQRSIERPVSPPDCLYCPTPAVELQIRNGSPGRVRFLLRSCDPAVPYERAIWSDLFFWCH